MRPVRLLEALKRLRGWLPPAGPAGSVPRKTKLDVKTGVALGIAAVLVAMSVFFMFVGVQGSYTTYSIQCPTGGPCVQSQGSGTYLTQVPAAVVPLLSASVAAFGLVKRSNILSWTGVAVLLVFSFLTGFSVGLLYFPFAIALVGLTAAILTTDPGRVDSETNRS